MKHNIPQAKACLKPNWDYAYFIQIATNTKKKKEIEIAKNEVSEIFPSIEQDTILEKIAWFKIWLHLSDNGLLDKNTFLGYYRYWREHQGRGYSKILISHLHQKSNKTLIDIDVYMLCTHLSEFDMQSKIELIAPLIYIPTAPRSPSRKTSDIIGIKNTNSIKKLIDKAVADEKIPGLTKAGTINSKHQYKGSKKELYLILTKMYKTNIKESIFNRGISIFIQTKSKQTTIKNRNSKPTHQK